MSENVFAVAVAPPSHFLAVCGECIQAKSFRTERERDLWTRNHAHQEDPA